MLEALDCEVKKIILLIIHLFLFFSQAVKLESLRAGRTRYLVVVSRPASRQAQQNLTAPSHNETVTVTSPSSPAGSILLNPTSYFNETTATTSNGGSRFSANSTATCDNDLTDDDSKFQCHHTGMVDDNQCETDSNVGSSCSRSSSNEIEESCLLGIDCNEKTTVGLVLRVLADTAIRLDGDG